MMEKLKVYFLYLIFPAVFLTICAMEGFLIVLLVLTPQKYAEKIKKAMGI